MSDILSTEEIDQLLKALSTGEVDCEDFDDTRERRTNIRQILSQSEIDELVKLLIPFYKNFNENSYKDGYKDGWNDCFEQVIKTIGQIIKNNGSVK